MAYTHRSLRNALFLFRQSSLPIGHEETGLLISDTKKYKHPGDK
jgi:hypothetical protein